MTACAICPRVAPDGQHACLLHADDLRGWLAELPYQARLLEAFVVPSASPVQGRLGGTGRAHAPVPVDLRVLVLLAPGHADPPAGRDEDDDETVPIRAILGAWAGHIAYHYPAAGRDAYGTARTQPCSQAWPRHGETISGWCAWLTAYLPFTLTLPPATVAQLHRQLGDLVHRVRDLTHAVPHRHPQGAPCPDCESFALVRTDGKWGITCEACGHHLEPDAYDEHAARFLKAVQAPATDQTSAA
ncbi:hypothetical protein [Streptomyces sp. HYC2]|uniref:hypothetical protein n=1 Tax=Streptomyces sp. HYC2 TaxID=2955207 RepID=UPI0024814DCA|nr:hypothetical protein [Streptomyces sp. HYC2]